jgi:uncharacterized protein
VQHRLTIKLLPSESYDDDAIKASASTYLSILPSQISGFNIIKRSIDARNRQPAVLLTLTAFVGEPYFRETTQKILFHDVSNAEKKVLIAGAGPAGLFAALKLIEQGIRPLIIERGKDVRARRRDLATLNKEGEVNPESNYCFGEGGAGTYSDGKLYTRSKKRGDVNRILNILVQFGAEENILSDAHPHIGTNKLPGIITAIKNQILNSGGNIFFERKITDLIIQNDSLKGVKCDDGNIFEADDLILATGHSARDIFTMLHRKNIMIENKPFAIGVRVEHPQQAIDAIQYHRDVRDEFLPPATYNVVEQVNGKGVFSFCMCPGGIIAPASTGPGELVVNGWSPSKRNNPFANSGMVVTVEEKDVPDFQKYGPLAAMEFQTFVERQAFAAGGGRMVAPAQRLEDFTRRKASSDLPDSSYLPGIRPALMHEIFPSFIETPLREAFIRFGRKMKGYLSNDAIVVAAESRTSSPVRIPRDPGTLEHPQIKGLYPCGEGAGYAGGIVSAAMDGEKIAQAITNKILHAYS